jgi:hypothetical protein
MVCSVSPETTLNAVDLSLKTQDFVPSLFFLGHFRSDSISGEEEKSVRLDESFEEVWSSQTSVAGRRRCAAGRTTGRRRCRAPAATSPTLFLSSLKSVCVFGFG